MTNKQDKPKTIQEIAASYRNYSGEHDDLDRQRVKIWHEIRMREMRIRHIDAVQNARQITLPLIKSSNK